MSEPTVQVKQWGSGQPAPMRSTEPAPGAGEASDRVFIGLPRTRRDLVTRGLTSRAVLNPDA